MKRTFRFVIRILGGNEHIQCVPDHGRIVFRFIDPVFDGTDFHALVCRKIVPVIIHIGDLLGRFIWQVVINNAVICLNQNPITVDFPDCMFIGIIDSIMCIPNGKTLPIHAGRTSSQDQYKKRKSGAHHFFHEETSPFSTK